MRLAALTLVAASLLSARVAVSAPASGADRALGDAVGKALLAEGAKLARDGKLDAARDKLEASIESDPSPEALLALADCEERLGATASAWGTYRAAQERARALGDARRTAQATSRAAALERRLSRARIIVAVAEPTFEVVLDDRTLAPEALGVAIPLDPGTHHVSVTRPGEPDIRVDFEVASDGHTQDVLVAPPAPPPPALLAALAPPERDAFEAASKLRWLPPPQADWGNPDVGDVSGPNWKKREKIALAFASTGAALTMFVTPIAIIAGVSLKQGTASDAFIYTGTGAISVGLPMLLGGYIGLQDASAHRSADAGPRLGVTPIVGRGTSGLSLGATF
jgi:hypothetical protein